MSKRRREVHGTPSQSALAGSPRAVQTGSAKALHTPRRILVKPRPIFFLIALVLVPLVLLAVFELLLRICGYGYSTNYFVKMEGTNAYTTNPKFGWRFCSPEIAPQPYPLILPAHKAPGTKRVFILGESAAQGTPVPAYGFGRILEVMLNEQFPQNSVEIMNVAMRGINSYAILPIAEECARHEPDLFLIYMGNNETIGLHAPQPGASLQPPLWMLRAGQSIKDAKLGQLMSNLIRRVRKKVGPEQDMAFFRKHSLSADSPGRNSVYENFQANLADILRVTQRSGAKVVLCTVAVNVADFPPLASLHRAKLAANDQCRWETAYRQGIEAERGQRFSEAITNYVAALGVDDHYAELHFRLGRSCRALDQTKEARKAFLLARDWDALQFRTDGRMNSTIHDLSRSAQPGTLTLVDVEDIFTTTAIMAKPADPRLFHEHVHLTFDGDYLLAKTVLAPTVAALGLTNTPGAKSIASRQKCAEALALSEWDEINLGMIAGRLTSKPPFLDQLEHEQRQREVEQAVQTRKQIYQQQNGAARALEVYRAALARRPNDWQIHMNCAMFLATLQDAKGVISEYDAAVKLMPVFVGLRTLYAQALATVGQRTAAIDQLEAALKIDPDYKAAKEGLASLR